MQKHMASVRLQCDRAGLVGFSPPIMYYYARTLVVKEKENIKNFLL